MKLINCNILKVRALDSQQTIWLDCFADIFCSLWRWSFLSKSRRTAGLGLILFFVVFFVVAFPGWAAFVSRRSRMAPSVFGRAGPRSAHWSLALRVVLFDSIHRVFDDTRRWFRFLNGHLLMLLLVFGMQRLLVTKIQTSLDFVFVFG